MAALQFPAIPNGTPATNPDGWRSYCVQLEESLKYMLGNLDSENSSTAHRAEYETVKAAATGAASTLGSLNFGASTATISGITALIESVQSSMGTAIGAKTTIYYQATEPDEYVAGDLWYDTSLTPVRIKRWSGVLWADITDDALGAALNAAGTAQATADGKVRTFAQDDAPADMVAGDVGDLWIDTNDNNALYRWSGTAWVLAQNDAINNVYLTSEGVNVKSTDGKFRAVFTSTGIVFYQNDAWIAEYSNNQLTTSRANIYDKLVMGTDTKGYFEWASGPNRLTLKYRAGGEA